MFSELMIDDWSRKSEKGDFTVVRRLAGGIQYMPERLILILYSSTRLRVMMQIYSTKYMKRNESAM